jgi:hypothetical protein
MPFLDPPVNLPGGNAFEVRFASQPGAGLQALLLGHAPVVIGFLAGDRGQSHSPGASNATSTSALTS